MANPQRNLERESVICALYREGRTLQEVGDVFGLTRERIRQILRRAGIAPDAGGSKERSRRRARERKQRSRIERDARTQATYGCYADELTALNQGQPRAAPNSLARAFIEQRRNAQQRGIEWALTFPEWVSVWEASGHIEERGRGGGLYCMARYHDIGPYEVGNVYITTCSGNTSDYQAELKRRGVECRDGFKRLPERAAVMQQEPSKRG